MKQEVGSRKQEVGKAAPVRGTQSFVGVMVEVWKRPGLTGIEIAWRWAVVAVLLVLGWWKFGPIWATPVGSGDQFETTMKMVLHGGYIPGLDESKLQPLLLGLIVVVVAWSAVSGVGRSAILVRLDRRLFPRQVTMAVLAILRSLSLLGVLCLWVVSLLATGWKMVLDPISGGAEPKYVPAFAIVVSATLVLFVLWCVVSWVLQLAPLFAMAKDEGVVASVRDAMRSGALRGKLIEINLVMGIVRVCLVVLAMVFSACPLPFSSVETQEFLNWWWAGVALFYVVFSDYFHVVRAAAYLRLWQAYGAKGIGDRG